jgi:hypothetical protein
MNRILIALILSIVAASVYALEPVLDDPHPTNGFEAHALGLLDYGAHDNTFNLKRYFVRGDYGQTFGGACVQVFAAVDGYKDTHWPESNYTMTMPTMNLWDGGVAVYFDLPLPVKYFVSFRAGAIYRADWSTLLWIPAIRNTNDVAEWEETDNNYDGPVQYIQDFFQASGVRTGFSGSGLCGGDWEIGYAQGDYRHNIPMAVRAFWTNKTFEFRALSQMNYQNAEVFEPSKWMAMGQISALARFDFDPVTVGFHADLTGWLDGRAHLQLEESVRCAWLTLAAREIACTWAPALWEGSVYWSAGGWKKDRATNASPSVFGDGNVVSIGVHASTDGITNRFYLGTLIDF